MGSIVIGNGRGVLILSSGGGSEYVFTNFLLRDDFIADDAGPLATPRISLPGPGTLTLVQTDGQFSISSGKLNFPVQTTPVFGDQGFYEAAGRSRAAGLAVIAQIRLSTSGGGGCFVAFSKLASVDFAGFANAANAMYFAGIDILALAAEAGSDVVGAIATSADYSVAIVLRATGAFYLIKGGAFTNWTLLSVAIADNTATVYPAFSNYDSVGSLSTFRVLDLPAPFDTDYGLATQRLSGARAAADTFTHEADCVIEWTQTTVPSNYTAISFRSQNATNYWRVLVGNSGDIELQEVVANSPTSRGTVAAVVSNGHRIVIVVDGSIIRVYSNNVLRITYSSASTFLTEISGTVQALGTGGAVSDIISWPRTLTGAAASLLDSAVA